MERAYEDPLAAISAGIYGTRGGPFRPGPWGASTHKDNSIYLHILSWPEETLILPPLVQKIGDAVVLTGGEVAMTQSDDGISISIAPADRDPINTLVRLTVKG